MMKKAGGLLLAIVLLAGCGDNGAAKKKMDAAFLRLDTQVAGMETVNAPFTAANLEQATQRYIALVRKYEHLLGAREAQRRLVAKGDELGAYCFLCRKMLYDAARKY